MQKALEVGRDREFRLRHPNHDDAGHPGDPADVSWADGLLHVAQAGLDALDVAAAAGRPPGERTQVILHLDADREVPPRLHLGPVLPSNIGDYLSCDASVRYLLLRHGQPVALGRRERTVNARLRTIIEHRDGGCRVPGCDQARWLHIHHLRHWANGGRTDPAEAPLAAATVGDQVEVLGLATGDLPKAEQGCSPYPWAAMRALGAGDLVLTLRVSMYVGQFDEWAETGIREPLASKPDELLGQETMPPGELPGGCGVDRVEQRQVDFIAHGRLYTAFLAHSGNLSEQRRDELREVWSSLTLRPIPTGDESATIGERYWHVLYTHCGIAGTEFAGRDWVAEPVLEDGNGNPPAGWGNPYQPGVMALTSPDRAEFESRDGAIEATFRPRTPADPPAQPCE